MIANKLLRRVKLLLGYDLEEIEQDEVLQLRIEAAMGIIDLPEANPEEGLCLQLVCLLVGDFSNVAPGEIKQSPAFAYLWNKLYLQGLGDKHENVQ